MDQKANVPYSGFAKKTRSFLSLIYVLQFRAKEKEKARGRVKRPLKKTIRAQRKMTIIKQMKPLPSCDVWMFLRDAVVSKSLKVIFGKRKFNFVITRL